MKIAQINLSYGFGSTGKIVLAVSELLNKKGIENYVFYSGAKINKENGIKYTNLFLKKAESVKSHILGNYGFDAKFATKKLIAHLDKIKPDIIHLHNLHSHDCNLELLFKYIKAKNIKVYWTFHDCWAFTGYCYYFDMADCNKWKTECKNCPQKSQFTWFVDCSNQNFNKKKKLSKDLDLTIITPSKWLADLVKQSFFKEYPVKVINNGIDLSVFKPTESDFRKKYACENKFILLGVAFDWAKRKGLDVFIELAKKLDDKFQIVLVGVNADLEKRLPQNIISINKTNNQKELAEIYTAADLYVNPTREEVFGLVNVEALACGTPVITFNSGGSPECIDETCGVVVPKDDTEALYNEILNICKSNPFTKEACINRAGSFDLNNKFKEYVDLYEE